jgi:hypothetical protein
LRKAGHVKGGEYKQYGDFSHNVGQRVRTGNGVTGSSFRFIVLEIIYIVPA